MASSRPSSPEACCFKEKQRLVEALRTCDFCSSNYEEHRRCWQEAARRSGERAKECMIG